MGGFCDEGNLGAGQKHAGGALDKGGRPIGTRRFTRETLSGGCRKAIAMALIQYGLERILGQMKARTTCTLTEEDLSARLSSMAGVSHRGEAWPLMHVFGIFSKCESGMASVAGEREVSCTWVWKSGHIHCSCQCKTRLLGVMRRSGTDTADIEFTLGAAMARTLRKLTRVLGIDPRSVRVVLGNQHQRCVLRNSDAVGGDGGDDGECQRFVVGPLVFGVAVTGHGDKVMAAPVRFTRHNTTCMLCDTAWTAARSHWSLTRHL